MSRRERARHRDMIRRAQAGENPHRELAHAPAAAGTVRSTVRCNRCKAVIAISGDTWQGDAYACSNCGRKSLAVAAVWAGNAEAPNVLYI